MSARKGDDPAAAVSNAGGLGIITGLTQRTPDDLAKEIRRCREMTDRPFGVNLTFLPIVNAPDYPGYVRAIVEGGVKVVDLGLERVPHRGALVDQRRQPLDRVVARSRGPSERPSARLRNTERVMRNAAVDRLLEKERTLAGVYPRIMKEGTLDAGALIDRIMAEADTLIRRRLAGLLGS